MSGFVISEIQIRLFGFVDVFFSVILVLFTTLIFTDHNEPINTLIFENIY